MNNYETKTLAVITGLAVLGMAWGGPFRQAAQSFNECVKTYSGYHIELNKEVPPELHRFRAVSVCNGGER